MFTTIKSRKVLIPMATLLAAGAIAVGSGATFTSTSHNKVSGVTSGTLLQSNSKDNKAILDLTNIKPGDDVSSTVTITNSGSLAQSFKLTETDVVDQFTTGDLALTIHDDTAKADVYSGSLGGLATAGATVLPGGAWAAGEAHTYTFDVALKSSAGNENQAKHAEAAFTWDGVQVDGSHTGQ